MIAITNILCPTDFSPSAAAALPIACALARDYAATLILLHVRAHPLAVEGESGTSLAESGESAQTDEALKAKMRQSVPAHFRGTVECHVRAGPAAEEILKTADERHSNLIVLGTHGRSGLTRLPVGSVAEAVLRKAPCPVMTIKPRPCETLAPLDVDASASIESPLPSTDLVTVCSVANPADAEVIRNALTNEKIPCFVDGAQQGGFAGMLGIPIRIQVRVGDSQRARNFIHAREAHQG